MIFENAPEGMRSVSLSDLNIGTIPASDIGYAAPTGEATWI